MYISADMYTNHLESTRKTQTYRTTIAIGSNIPMSPKHDRTRHLSRHSQSFSSSTLVSPVLVSPLDQARVQRRRLQNRASQRAFRERKNHHTEVMQAELNVLFEMHQGLSDAYQRKEDEVDTLRARVEQLNWEIGTMQVSAACGGNVFSDPDGDHCERDVVKVEDGSASGSSLKGSESGMAFDKFSRYGGFTLVLDPWGDVL